MLSKTTLRSGTEPCRSVIWHEKGKTVPEQTLSSKNSRRAAQTVACVAKQTPNPNYILYPSAARRAVCWLQLRCNITAKRAVETPCALVATPRSVRQVQRAVETPCALVATPRSVRQVQLRRAVAALGAVEAARALPRHARQHAEQVRHAAGVPHKRRDPQVVGEGGAAARVVDKARARRAALLNAARERAHLARVCGGTLQRWGRRVRLSFSESVTGDVCVRAEAAA